MGFWWGGGALQEVVACCFVELINLTCTITPVKFQSLLDALFQPASRCTSQLANGSALHVPQWRTVRGNSMHVTMCDLHYVSVLYAGNIYKYIFMSLSFHSTKFHSLTTRGGAQQVLKCSLMDSPPGRCCGKLWLILTQCRLYWRLSRWMLNVPVCTMHLGTAQPLYPFPLQPRLENIHELATLY